MTKKPQQQEQSLPWYRYPIVWFAFALPVIVVIASMVTIVIAHKNPPQMLDKVFENQTESSQQNNSKP